MQIKELMAGRTEKNGEAFIKAEVRVDIFPTDSIEEVHKALEEEIQSLIDMQTGNKPTTKKPAQAKKPATKKPEEKPAKKPATKKPKVINYDRTIEDHKGRLAEILDERLDGWKVRGSEEAKIAGSISKGSIDMPFLEELDGKVKVLESFIENVVKIIEAESEGL